MRARAPLDFELICLRHALARAFGARHGLAPTSGPFSITALREGRKPGGWNSLQAAWDLHLTDHPTFYRTPDRRAAAVAAHLYGLTDETRWRCVAWAAAHRLDVAFPTDFPSWWYPGWTKLVVYTGNAFCRPVVGSLPHPETVNHPGDQGAGRTQQDRPKTAATPPPAPASSSLPPCSEALLWSLSW